MSPVVSATTQALYDSLPAVYSTVDATVMPAPNDQPLLRFLDCLVTQLDQVVQLYDQINLPSSALTNPYEAQAAWLPWLAQLVGVQIPNGTPTPVAQAMIASAAGGWNRGTRQAIIGLVQSQLTGSQFVQLVDHANGDQWQMQIITRPEESPVDDQIIATIIAAGAKPAGVVLTHLLYAASWQTIESNFTTWNLWYTAPSSDPLRPAGSWAALEESQPNAFMATWAGIEISAPTWTAWEALTWAQLEALVSPPLQGQTLSTSTVTGTLTP